MKPVEGTTIEHHVRTSAAKLGPFVAEYEPARAGQIGLTGRSGLGDRWQCEGLEIVARHHFVAGVRDCRHGISRMHFRDMDPAGGVNLVVRSAVREMRVERIRTTRRTK